MNEPLTVADAEQSLLGAVLSGFEPDDIDVEADDFYQPLHGDVWAAICRVKAAGNKPDVVSVRLALADRKPAVDPIWLVDLGSRAPATASAPYYAEQVKAAAGLRALQSAGTRILELGSTPGDLEERREAARQAVDDACRGKVTTRARSMAEMLPDAIEAAEHGTGAVLDTGWPDLDRLIGGLAPGRLVVFGARPGGGKSIAGTNLALHFAHHHEHAALICSLEMPESEVMNRILAAHARVNLTALGEAKVDESSWGRLAAKHEELSGLPIYVDDSSSLTVQGVRRLARDVQRTRDDLAIIVVDYLQLLTPAEQRKGGTRAEEVSGIARGLKQLARETGACVVAMAQVNRDGGREGGPSLTDLREGGIENDADVVVLLHQPDPDMPEVTVEVAKNRHGPKGVLALQVQGHYARLASTQWRPAAVPEVSRHQPRALR